jgi:hypothetical protein
VDQPPDIQALQDREPFAILARHLSGVSTVAESRHDGSNGGPQPVFEPPPDGGMEAWLVVMGAWFVLFVQFGISKCLPLFGLLSPRDRARAYQPVYHKSQASASSRLGIAKIN